MEKIFDACSLVDELVQELKKLSPEDYLEIKLMLLACAATNWGKTFLEKVFYVVERQRPLLIGTKEATSKPNGSRE